MYTLEYLHGDPERNKHLASTHLKGITLTDLCPRKCQRCRCPTLSALVCCTKRQIQRPCWLGLERSLWEKIQTCCRSQRLEMLGSSWRSKSRKLQCSLQSHQQEHTLRLLFLSLPCWIWTSLGRTWQLWCGQRRHHHCQLQDHEHQIKHVHE